MTSTNHHEESLKALRRKEIERLWFDQEATDEELLEVYKSLDIKDENLERFTVIDKGTYQITKDNMTGNYYSSPQ
tara:strand:- start:65 stop:289 length:225 start_codon:yes stop_codon:yes gene_type:complete